MKKSTFQISQMDCPSEEQIIRMKLEGFDTIKQLSFDIPNRKLELDHNVEVKIYRAIGELELNVNLENSQNFVMLLTDKSSIKR